MRIFGTPFVGVATILRLIAKRGPEAFLAGLAAYIEEDFRRWPRFEKSARLASHSRDGVIELMPTSDGALYAFKYVNGHPANTGAGKLTVTAFGVLADVATGYPLLVSEMTIATAMRTAATSAMAAKFLARKDSSVMAIIGLGAQSEFQALAFKATLGVRHLRVFDIDRAATRKFMVNLAPYGFAIVEAASAEEAVRGADIVTTATAAKSRAAVLTKAMLVPGVHINAIGGDCPGKTEIDVEALKAAAIFVEFPPQTRIEGEIQQLPEDSPVTELWRVIAGSAPGRGGADDITLFDSVGFAIEDFSTLRYLSDLLAASGIDSRIDLVPDMRDPKDLFGMVGGGSAAIKSAPFAQEAGV